MANMCAKPGKILSPNRTRVLHSPSTLTMEERRRNRYIMKNAIRSAVDDMVAILESGDRKATTFLISEIERLFDGQSLNCGKKSRWAVCRKTDKSGAFYVICVVVSMCGKAGKIITTPKAVRVIHSSSTLSVDSRSHYRYLLKRAIRTAVDDMKEILDGGDPKSAVTVRSHEAKSRNLNRNYSAIHVPYSKHI